MLEPVGEQFLLAEYFDGGVGGAELRGRFRGAGDAGQTLHELGAIDDARNLTPIGRGLARLPVDPRVGRMLLAAIEENCVEEVLVIASALSIADPRLRPADAQDAADAAHARFADPRSDFLTYLNIWRFFHEQSRKLSSVRN